MLLWDYCDFHKYVCPLYRYTYRYTSAHLYIIDVIIHNYSFMHKKTSFERSNTFKDTRCRSLFMWSIEFEILHVTACSFFFYIARLPGMSGGIASKQIMKDCSIPRGHRAIRDKAVASFRRANERNETPCARMNIGLVVTDYRSPVISY